MFTTWRTTLSFKHFAFFMALAMLIVMIAPSCTEKKVINPTPTPENDIQSLEAKAQVLQDWINRMDQFVTQNSDGTYTLDRAVFLGTIQASHHDVYEYFTANGQKTTDAEIVEQFINVISITNAEILKGENDEVICGSACWHYWWGYRCCYWGNEAHYAIAAMSFGGISGPLWPIRLLLGAYAIWAQLVHDNHDGFCINWCPIGNTIWITAP
jgi:hypothetical protein